MADEVPGYHREWVPDDAWEMGGDDHRCRMKGCREPAVASLRRTHRSGNTPHGFRRWYYCERHLYGRKIMDGVVKSEILVENKNENETPRS